MDAHDGSVCSTFFLPSQPLLLTTGSDNSVKVLPVTCTSALHVLPTARPHQQMWLFDQADDSGRLLRSRSGHSAPPARVRFHGSDSITLLSCGPVLHCPNPSDW